MVAEAVVEDENDQQQLGPMIEQVRENTGSVAEQTLGDRGYDTAESLAKAEALEAPVIVAQRVNVEKVGPYHLARFTYDEQAQTVHCPIGQQLRRVGVATHHREASPADALSLRCLGELSGGETVFEDRSRVVEIGPHYGAVQRQRQKMTDPDNQLSMKLAPCQILQSAIYC